MYSLCMCICLNHRDEIDRLILDLDSGCLYSVEWNGGMEWWNGTMEWNSGME